MVTAPLLFEKPCGTQVTIQNWSLAALAWPEDAGEAPKTGTLNVPFQGVDVRFPVRLKPAPDRPGELCLSGLSGRQRETLALFYRSLLSGKMASSAEVITSLDTPLDLVPMEETESEKAATEKPSAVRTLRAVLNVVVYMALALAIVGVVGQNILTNLNRIDIQHGRVANVTTEVQALADGEVKYVNVTAGQAVEKGDVLVTLRNRKGEAELNKAKNLLGPAKDAHQAVKDDLTRLDALTQELDPALRDAGLALLFESYLPKRRFEDVNTRFQRIASNTPAAAAPYDPAVILRSAILKERDIRAVDVKKRRADVLGRRDFVQSTQIVAPANGIVREVLISKGQFLPRRTPVLTFETDEMRQTVGWVSEKFAETLYIGMPATIGFNTDGTRQRLTGTIVDLQADNNPQRPGEYGILVFVEPNDLSVTDARAQLRVGAPVNLEASRQTFPRLKRWISSRTAPDA
ncbi:HlyD family efflux transporter periplasmic adaptor subunit [Shimia isoporae]|nr:HlyD family efflux transporter periplasmic adaptor subunit [Shimia isoporae]